MLSALALSFGLAMDATAVCAARALGARNHRELVILPALFGIFQAGMAALGWLVGRVAGPYIEKWDHWVAFGLLLLIGGHMVYEGWHAEDEAAEPGSPLLYLGLALATSIDAAAAGITLPLVPVKPWIALLLIGAVTAGLSAIGYGAGRALGKRVGPKLGILGGLVLVGIGVNMLIQAA